MKPQFDPVTLEIIRSRLEYGAQHMAQTLWRSASSITIREVLDYSTALFTAEGEMVAQSAQLPFQMMTMSAPMRCLVEQRYPWAPGDAILVNDPYLAAGQHLPDVMVFRPIFSRRRLVGFAGVIAHMLDIGGGAPGSYVASATEIYQEGLRIPPVKIQAAGKLQTEVADFVRANVREDESVMGDISAMIACTAIGEAALLATCDKYGDKVVEGAMCAILAQSERMMRRRLTRLSFDNLEAMDYVDDDGIDDRPIPLKLRISRSGQQIVLDFTGSAPQVKGPVNATLAMTDATVNYVLMATFGAGIPKNDGCRRAVEIIAPAGTVVNATSPAPVASRVTTCHRLVDLVLSALAPAFPDKVMAGYYGNSAICNIGGRDSRTGRPWIHFEIEVGGWGARPKSDGLDGFSAHLHNLANTPVEIVEQMRPLRVERYEFIPNSGGKGQFRGGLGLRRDIRLLQGEASLNLLADRHRFPPRGLRGGGNGKAGAYLLNPDTPKETKLRNKLANYPMKAGDVISFRTSGGGGMGPARLRAKELSKRDRREGKVTAS